MKRKGRKRAEKDGKRRKTWKRRARLKVDSAFSAVEEEEERSTAVLQLHTRRTKENECWAVES